jgi:hypothetical protein
MPFGMAHLQAAEVSPDPKKDFTTESPEGTEGKDPRAIGEVRSKGV